MSQHKIDQFVKACGNNDVSEVRRLLSEGVDINGRDDDRGETGLHGAMAYDSMDIVRLLLSDSDIQLDRANSRIADFSGCTALHTACYSDNVEGVRLFLAHPSCTKDIVNIRDADGGENGQTAETEANERNNHDCATLVREYLERADKLEEVDVQRMVEMIKTGGIPDEGPTKQVKMTLTEVAESIEKNNAEGPIIEAATNKIKDDHNKEIFKLKAQHGKKLKSLLKSHKRKVDSIVNKNAVENNKCKMLREENEERKESLHSQLQVLLSPPGQPAMPPPSSLIPSCPVCLENMRPPLQIFTCGNGHLVCSVCRPKVSMDKCYCQAVYMGRATAMEQMVKQVLGIM